MVLDPLELPDAVAAILIAGLVVFAHRANIQRLMAGTESKFDAS
jgi:glycerol-3-phosphate acyltransferase PlsY